MSVSPSPPAKTPGSAHENASPPTVPTEPSPGVFSDLSLSGLEGRKRLLDGAETSHRGRKFLRGEHDRVRQEEPSPLAHKSTGDHGTLLGESSEEDDTMAEDDAHMFPETVAIEGDYSPVADIDPIHAFNSATVHDRRHPENKTLVAEYVNANRQTSVWAYLSNAVKYRNTDVGAETIQKVVDTAFPVGAALNIMPGAQPIRRVIPPTTAPGAVKPCMVYAVTGLSNNVAHTLVSTKVLSTPDGTIFFMPIDQPKYRYAASFIGLNAYGNGQAAEVRLAVIEAMKKSATVTNLIVAGGRIANPALTAVSDAEIIRQVTESVSVSRHEFPRANPGDADRGKEAIWNVDANNPLRPEDSATWELRMRELNIPMVFGLGIGRAPYTCAYCQGRNHPTVGCTLPSRPGWLDTEDIATAAIPGLNVDILESSVVVAARGRGTGRGRGRGGARGARGGRGGRGASLRGGRGRGM